MQAKGWCTCVGENQILVIACICIHTCMYMYMYIFIAYPIERFQDLPVQLSRVLQASGPVPLYPPSETRAYRTSDRERLDG